MYKKKKQFDKHHNNNNFLWFVHRSRHVGLRPVQVRDGLSQHRFQGVRGRGGQVFGVGGGHERT